ncbi:MAG: hypothetical protein ACR2M2_04880 [Gaiellaceae bacterium]
MSVQAGPAPIEPLEVYVSKFAHVRFEPTSLTNDPGIRSRADNRPTAQICSVGRAVRAEERMFQSRPLI